MAQFRELAAFSQFGSDLDKTTQAQLARGERLVEVLKQGQYVPMPVVKQVVQIYAATNGYVDEYPTRSVVKYLSELSLFIESKHADILDEIDKKKTLDDDLKKKINAALDDFKKIFSV